MEGGKSGSLQSSLDQEAYVNNNKKSHLIGYVLTLDSDLAELLLLLLSGETRAVSQFCLRASLEEAI